MKYFVCITLLVYTSKAHTKNESCKDILQNFLTGQLSSVLGSYQIEALKREFKSFTELTEKSIAEFKEQVKTDLRNKSTESQKVNVNAVYTRWGKKSCPSTAELVYSGFVGGSHYTHTGAAVDPLCLPKNPEWGKYKDGTDSYRAYVYGAEYEEVLHNNKLNLLEHDVPCAVCLLRGKSLSKVFPARKSCYRGWRLEYSGYLMAGYYGHNAGTMYTCIDENPDTVFGGHSNHNGYLFYAVEAQCGSLKCPPYVQGRELTCAVCSV
ncbi:short-chain collagen C4-like [Saccostrea cucullata]|uniref:short-chain collagen C4-like n=1 Tax=Saccostrea cuccullata TaxID=36930 RepID=UPI002ECFC459